MLVSASLLNFFTFVEQATSFPLNRKCCRLMSIMPCPVVEKAASRNAILDFFVYHAVISLTTNFLSVILIFRRFLVVLSGW